MVMVSSVASKMSGLERERNLGNRQRHLITPTSSRPKSLATLQGRRTGTDRTRDQPITSWARGGGGGAEFQSGREAEREFRTALSERDSSCNSYLRKMSPIATKSTRTHLIAAIPTSNYGTSKITLTTTIAYFIIASRFRSMKKHAQGPLYVYRILSLRRFPSAYPHHPPSTCPQAPSPPPTHPLLIRCLSSLSLPSPHPLAPPPPLPRARPLPSLHAEYRPISAAHASPVEICGPPGSVTQARRDIPGPSDREQSL
jgi:hypothetical protein